MADKSRADELTRYDLCIVGIGGGWPALDHHLDGEHCKAEQAVTIIRELEARIAELEESFAAAQDYDGSIPEPEDLWW
jgi:hypothetical protein